METSIEDEDVLDSVRDLNIAHDAPQDRGKIPLGSTRSNTLSLEYVINVLIQSAQNTASRAQTVRSLADNANLSGNLLSKEVCSVHEGTKKLADIVLNLQSTLKALNEAAERSIIRLLTSLGSQSPPIVFEILSHFDEQIKNIVRKVSYNTSDEDILWKVAEECYKQATTSSGTLAADDYFIPLEEACLESPYDPDFESEEYYEHENRLNVDEDYAAVFQKRTERRSEARNMDRQEWPEFWTKVLNNSPGGPTLFYPTGNFSAQSLRLDVLPPYLFRTFDEDSSGQNDEGVIASKASTIGSHASSRTDILRLEMCKATELLHTHLNKSCFDGKESDNLMSWTSSLLFAIQYAVWRLNQRQCHPSDIKICAVDTRKFPKGQFAQDLWLLEAYQATAEQMGDPERKFFDFRLQNEDFYNGEYLSQGVVNHAGRSCVASLQELIEAGLFQLYPEFEDARGSEKWSKRVLELRRNWAVEQGATDYEIQLALKVGHSCFAQFDPISIACILLAFKHRKGSRIYPTENLNHSNIRRPRWADKPVEVRRYWNASQAVMSYNENTDDQLLPQHHKTLREIFD